MEEAPPNRTADLLDPAQDRFGRRIVGHLEELRAYTDAIWEDCRELERMWLQGELSAMIDIEDEELEIARSQHWGGSPAIFAADGLFSFGAHPEE